MHENKRSFKRWNWKQPPSLWHKLDENDNFIIANYHYKKHAPYSFSYWPSFWLSVSMLCQVYHAVCIHWAELCTGWMPSQPAVWHHTAVKACHSSLTKNSQNADQPISLEKERQQSDWPSCVACRRCDTACISRVNVSTSFCRSLFSSFPIDSEISGIDMWLDSMLFWEPADVNVTGATVAISWPPEITD